MSVDTRTSSSGRVSELTQREVSAYLSEALAMAGSLERGELVRVLRAHGAPAKLVDTVERRVPAGVRIRDVEALWGFLPEAAEDADEALLHIGEVAERVGLSVRTVRYYEEVGLVDPSGRSDGGFRLYSEADVRQLVLVKRMKAFGLSLDEMGELLDVLASVERAEELEQPELSALVVKLQLLAERGDDRIARLERDLEGARQLRLELSERLGRCRAAFERRRREEP